MTTNKKVISAANTDEKNRKLNILTFCTHEAYETQLCKTGHYFYAFTSEKLKKWNANYCNIPSNYSLMPEDQLVSCIDFDLILSQDRFSQFSVAKKIQQYLRVPLVALEHTTLGPNTDEQHKQYFQNQIGDLNIFISDFSRKEFGITHNTKIIHHSIDTEKFCDKDLERDSRILTVANDFINRDYCLNFSGWNRIADNFEHTLIGDTPGISKPVKSEELVDIYNSHLVYLNTTTHSPIPTSLLEAMACGCAVVSTATCMIPEVIEDGVNGFISNDESVLIDKIRYLLDNPEKAKEMGKKARQTIIEKFNETDFINNWNNALRSVV